MSKRAWVLVARLASPLVRGSEATAANSIGGRPGNPVARSCRTWPRGPAPAGVTTMDVVSTTGKRFPATARATRRMWSWALRAASVHKALTEKLLRHPGGPEDVPAQPPIHPHATKYQTHPGMFAHHCGKNNCTSASE